MLRLKANWIVIDVEPWELDELIDVMPEIARRHRRRHRLGAGARQHGGHLNRGKVHSREIADWQQSVRHRPKGDDAQHDERRCHGPLDEQCGDVHGVALVSLFLTLIRLPATSRS